MVVVVVVDYNAEFGLLGQIGFDTNLNRQEIVTELGGFRNPLGRLPQASAIVEFVGEIFSDPKREKRIGDSALILKDVTGTRFEIERPLVILDQMPTETGADLVAVFDVGNTVMEVVTTTIDIEAVVILRSY